MKVLGRGTGVDQGKQHVTLGGNPALKLDKVTLFEHNRDTVSNPRQRLLLLAILVRPSTMSRPRTLTGMQQDAKPQDWWRVAVVGVVVVVLGVLFFLLHQVVQGLNQGGLPLGSTGTQGNGPIRRLVPRGL